MGKLFSIRKIMAIRKFFVLIYIVIFFSSIILSSNFSLGSTANYYYIDVDVNDDGSITVREEYSLKENIMVVIRT